MEHLKIDKSGINNSNLKQQHGIVIPCYNESSRLELDTFIAFAKKHKGATICFVNDGSADMTRSTLANIKNMVTDNVHIFNVSENAGKANAVLRGSMYLYQETEVDTIGFLDADLSTTFEDYAILIDTLLASPEKKIVFGSRNMGGEGTTIERNPVRKLLSEIIRFLIFMVSRLKIKDTQCGAKVFDRSLIPVIYEKQFYSRWLFDVEILLRLKRTLGIQGFYKIFIEKPLTSWVHMDGSKLDMKDSLMIPLNLLEIWANYGPLPLLRNKFKKVKEYTGNLISKFSKLNLG